jgi:hypothetical protein
MDNSEDKDGNVKALVSNGSRQLISYSSIEKVDQEQLDKSL